MTIYQPPEGGMTPREVLELGGEFIVAGIGVFPIALRKIATKVEKRPLTRHGHESAVLTTDRLRRLIADGIGRLRDDETLGLGGHLTEHVMFDFDEKNGARGAYVREMLRAQYGDDIARVAFTSVSGATNWLMRKPVADVAIGNHSPWSDYGVDVRADKGWFVVPGTFCPWGKWEWLSGDLEDLEDNYIPPDVWRQLRETQAAGDGTPADDATVEAWLDANELTAMDSPVLRRELADHVTAIRTAANRHPAMWDALTWIRRQDGHVDRRRAFSEINAAWKLRMSEDGESERRGECEEKLPLMVAESLAWEAQRDDDQLATDVASEASDEDESSEDTLERLLGFVDLAPYLDGTIEQPTPDGLLVDGERGLLYLDRLNSIYGPSGTGKSWLAAVLAREMAEAGKTVVWLEHEDTPMPLVERLQQMGVANELIATHVKVVVWPQVSFSPAALTILVRNIAAVGADHVVVDSLGEAFGAEGIDENSDAEVVEWLQRVVRHLIRHTGAGVTLIDHITKAADNPLYPSGSKRKRAAITGASWLLEATKPFTRTESGHVRITCGKDRHGHYAQGTPVAELAVEWSPLGDCEVTLRALGDHSDDPEYAEVDETDRWKWERVLAVGRRIGRPMSASEWKVEFGKGLKGPSIARETITGMLESLCRQGLAGESAGPRNSRLFEVYGIDDVRARREVSDGVEIDPSEGLS